MSIKVMIIGKGRMAKMLVDSAPLVPGIEIVDCMGRGESFERIAEWKADVVVDFSSHDVIQPLAQFCVLANKPLIIGTTGHTEGEMEIIKICAERIPIVKATTFSTGVNLLFWLTRRAGEILGPGFDYEIVEIHHRKKKDAPSGTAKTLLEILADARRIAPKAAAKHGRLGNGDERTKSEIGIHAVRGGDVVGEHTVYFFGDGERVELTHRASSRNTFALGALRAVRWVVGKPPGLYDMNHVLGLS